MRPFVDKPPEPFLSNIWGDFPVVEQTWRMPEPLRSATLNYLAGLGQNKAFPKAITDPGQGGKFDKDGRVLLFPGNTFICHIDQTSRFYHALGAIQDELKSSPLADHYTFLPKPSFHMTVFCGVCGSPLGEDGWPEGIAATASLQEITGTYAKRLSNWAGPTDFDVIAAGMSSPGIVAVKPATGSDQRNLSDARQKLEEITGIYRPDIATYEFHVSLGYLRRWFARGDADAAIAVAETLFSRHLMGLSAQCLGPIEFCMFDTMHQFEPVQLLAEPQRRCAGTHVSASSIP